MEIRKADLSDAAAVIALVSQTIRAVYPHYYPPGAVAFFLAHHSGKAVDRDIRQHRVFVCLDRQGELVGTVTIKNNEICRLFVLPERQGKGYGTKLLDFAEETLFRLYPEIRLDASFPAKRLYQNRGYRERAFQVLETQDGDFLCYDVMVKQNAPGCGGQHPEAR